MKFNKSAKNFKLTLGKYISNNYIDITRNNNLVTVHKAENNTIYANKNKLVNKIEKGTSKNYFKIDKKYISKTSKDAVDGSYQYFPLPSQLLFEHFLQIIQFFSVCYPFSYMNICIVFL